MKDFHNHTSMIGALTMGAFCSTGLGGLVPNGDFNTPDGAGYTEVFNDTGNFEFSYPTEGGNPGAYGIIDNTGGPGAFGIWVIEVEDGVDGDGNPVNVAVSLDSLNLVAGEIYEFSQDMILLDGQNIGGLKVDFFNGQNLVGTTGDMNPDLIGDGSGWETYDFTVAIPANADGIRMVPLWGPASSVGFDNFCVDPTSLGTAPVPPPFPNGDFENGSNNWLTVSDNMDIQVTYPETGGNPDGHVLIDDTVGLNPTGFAILISNGAQAGASLDALGLAPGDDVTITQDMRIFEGNEIGGVKIEFLDAANVVIADSTDLRAPLIGDGSTWETYEFTATIPDADALPDGQMVASVRLALLWGPNSIVGFDNVQQLVVEPVPPASLDAAFVEGTIVSWTPLNEDSRYQLQGSEDGAIWTDIGPQFLGTALSQYLAPGSQPSYRVVETRVDNSETLLSTTRAEGVGLSFDTDLGREYRIEFSEDLEEFEPLVDGIIGTGTEISLGTPQIDMKGFFRFVALEEAQ